MRLLLALGLSLPCLCACAAPAPKAPSCAAPGAIYKLRGQPSAVFRLVKPPHPMGTASDLIGRLDLEGQTWWYSLTSSNGYSHDYLISEADPFKASDEDERADKADESDESDDGGTLEMVFFDSAYNVLEGPPQGSGKAPAHLLATGLGTALWYSTPRHELKKSIWDLSVCADKAAL